MTAHRSHTIADHYCYGYGRRGLIAVWISVPHDAGRVVFFPLYIMEEYSDWGNTREYVRDKKILYVLTEDDAQGVAQAEFGRELTEDELLRVKKGVESGLGDCWTAVMEAAVDAAIGQ